MYQVTIEQLNKVWKPLVFNDITKITLDDKELKLTYKDGVTRIMSLDIGFKKIEVI